MQLQIRQLSSSSHYIPTCKSSTISLPSCSQRRAIFWVNDLAITTVSLWYFYNQLEEQPAKQICAQFTV